MLILGDHLMLLGAFFLTGLALGFFMAYVLIQSSNKRL